jgi:hypothetical protein
VHRVNNTITLIGNNFNSLNNTKIEDCNHLECRIHAATPETLDCDFPSESYDVSCENVLTGELEGERFSISLNPPANGSVMERGGAGGTPWSWLVLAGVVTVCLIVLGLVLFVSRRCRTRKGRGEEDGNSSIIPLPVDPHFGGVGRTGNRYRAHPNPDGPMELSAPPPYEDLGFLVPEKLRIPMERIDIACEIGSGHFGIVYKAQYTNHQGTVVPVAVKTLHSKFTANPNGKDRHCL